MTETCCSGSTRPACSKPNPECPAHHTQAGDARRLDQEAFHCAAVVERDRTDRQWCRHRCDEPAEALEGQGPDFDVDCGTAPIRRADHAGLQRYGAGKRIKPIVAAGRAREIDRRVRRNRRGMR